MPLFTIIAAVISVVVGVASYVQAKAAAKNAGGDDDQGILLTKQDNNAGLKVIYGERRVGGVKVFKDVHRLAVQPAAGRTLIGQNLNGIDSTYVQKEVRIFLDRVDVIGEGPIHSVTDIEIEGDAWSSARYGKHDHMSYRGIIMDGSVGQAHLSELGAIYPRWNSTSVGEGVAYVQSRFRNQAGFQVYNSEPSVQYQVKGKLIYDPRKDTAYGGVGSHSATDVSTWEWSDNPSLCLLDYLTADYGRALDISVINVPSFITAANSCDINVAVPARLINEEPSIVSYYNYVTGTWIDVNPQDLIPHYRPNQVGVVQKRLTCNIVIDPAEEVLENVKKLLESMKGNLPYHQGKYSLRLEDSGTSVMDIGEDDIIGGISFGDGDQSGRFNRVTIKFPNRNKRYNVDQVSWPKIGSTEYNAYLAEDQDQQLWHEVELSAVTDFYQAEDIAEYIVRNSRASMSCEIKVKSKGLLLEPTDIISVTHSSPAWSGKDFRVQGIKIDTDFTCTLSLSEYQDSVYQWSDTANEPDQPDTGIPSPFSDLPALTGISGTVGRVDSADGVPQGLVTLTWDPIVDFEVDEYVLRYKQTTETVFQVEKFPETSRVQDVDPSLNFIAPQHNVTYDIYLSYTVTSTSRASDVVTTTVVIPEYRTDIDIEIHDIELENGLSVTDEWFDFPFELGSLSDVVVSVKASEIEINRNATLLAESVKTLELELTTGGIQTNADAISQLVITLDDTDDAVTANAVAITGLGVSITDLDTELTATAASLDTVELELIATNDSITAVATRTDELELTVNDPSTGLDATANALSGTQLQLTQTDTDVTALAVRTDSLELTVNNPTTGVDATAASLSNTQLDVSDIDGDVTAVAVRTDNLEVTVNNPTTGVAATASVTQGMGVRIDATEDDIDDISAEYFVRADVNGNVAGFGLVNQGTSSEFSVYANKFTLVDPSAPTAATSVPFSVNGGVTTMQNVVIDGGLMVDNTVTADKILVTDLSAVSANLGTVTAGTLKTATSGYRVEVSDAGDFPIWYGIGAKTAANGLFYVKKDGSVFINAVVNAQAGSTVELFDMEAFYGGNQYGYSNNPINISSGANPISYAYTSGSGNYSYSWASGVPMTNYGQTISSTTIAQPTFTALGVPLNGQSLVSWRVTVTDTSTGATSYDDVLISMRNIGPIS